MAPIPTSFTEEAADLVSSLQRKQQDLTEYQIPRLRSCEGPLTLQQDLAGELRADCDAFEGDLEALDLCIDDQKAEKKRTALREVVEELRSQLLKIRQDSRAALLTSKRTIDSQSRSKREELLASTAKNEKLSSVSEKSGEDAFMKTNDDITEGLRRTIVLMQGELERSVLTTQMLETSTATLRSTSTTHDTLTNLMGVSKQLITALEKADWLDRLLILSAFFFFLLVILLILKQRILDRSLRIAFWWTRFIPMGSKSSSIKAGIPDVPVSPLSTVLSASSSLAAAATSVTAAAAAIAASSITLSPSQSATPDTELVEGTDTSGILTSVLPSESASPVSSVAEPSPTPLAHEDEL